MPKVAVVFLVCTVLLAPAFASEPSPEEAAWIAECVGRLESPSDRVAEGAAASLRAFDADAVGAMVGATASLHSDAAWRKFEEVLRSFGAGDASAALEGARGQWPKEVVPKLQAILDGLRSAKEPAVDPDVETKVRKAFAHLEGAMSYSSTDAGVRQVVAMGHEAFPVLVKMLRESGGVHGFGFVSTAAADALAALAKKEDLPVLARLLEDGILLAARGFRSIHGDAARDALLVPVNKGFMDHDLLDALKLYRDDPEVRDALLSYLDRIGGGGFSTGLVAEYLGEIGEFRAIPSLKEILASSYGLDVRRPVATALAKLGEKDAIPVLIEIVREGAGKTFDAWQCQRAGEELNRIAGRRWYVGRMGPDRSENGNFLEAAEKFEEWWDENRDRLRYHRNWRRWEVEEKEEAPDEGK